MEVDVLSAVVAVGVLAVIAILVIAFVSDEQPEDWDDIAPA